MCGGAREGRRRADVQQGAAELGVESDVCHRRRPTSPPRPPGPATPLGGARRTPARRADVDELPTLIEHVEQLLPLAVLGEVDGAMGNSGGAWRGWREELASSTKTGCELVGFYENRVRTRRFYEHRVTTRSFYETQKRATVGTKQNS